MLVFQNFNRFFKDHIARLTLLNGSFQSIMSRVNEYGQLIGEAMPNWTTRRHPEGVTLTGRTCRVEPLHRKHIDDLFAAFSQAPDGRDWTYLIHIDRCDNIDAFREYIESIIPSTDPQFYAVINLGTGKAVGFYSLLRIDPKNGAIEIGHISFSPLLKQTIQSTEAQFLMMAYAFEQLGYRRYEWKCDAFNEPSRKAAIRLGFNFESIFRNGSIYKNRSRDIAWFSIIDKEWPARKAAFESWLAPENFDKDGRQIKSLTAIQESFKR